MSVTSNVSDMSVSPNPEQLPLADQPIISAGYHEEGTPEPSPLPQYDGQDDTVADAGAVISDTVRPRGQAQPRLAPYVLNKTKQLINLSNDASKPDFEIEITHGTNVNVHCSTGFYLSVAKPAFSNLSKGYKGVISVDAHQKVQSKEITQGILRIYKKSKGFLDF